MVPLLAGCGAPIVESDVRQESLSVEGILDRCSSAYRSSRTLRAHGALRTHAMNGPMTQPIEWDYSAPDRYRLQIGQDAAMLLGDSWWLYRASDGRFRTPRRTFDQTPLRTVSYMLSYPVALIEPMILETGSRAFSGPRASGFENWTMRRVDWRDGVPCYVVDRRSPAGVLGNELRLWVDQDKFLIRAWTLRARRPDGESAAVADCWYDMIALNAPIEPERFHLEKPGPIESSSDSAPPDDN